MSNNAHDKTAQEEHFAEIFARLREQDIEQFYAHYQLWVLRRRLPLIENQLEALREHLAENQQVTESLRPSALALAVLVRLQSNGVNDTDVLDRMLERGEDWLDCMMQRLDYCEQVEDFIQGDYNQWCIKSLEGAYDWIDSLLGSIKEDHERPENPEPNDEATEKLLLQKLSQDGEEAMLEVTLKQPAISDEAANLNNAILSTESLVTSEPELTTLSNEQVTELDENNKPEPAPRAAEVIEPQEKSEPEQPPELFGWKDLEDLEAPEEEPVPWYSIDLTEDGATSAPNGTKQAATMNDWINILHAETTTSEEANTAEAATDSATEPPSSTNPAEAADEIHTPAPESEIVDSPVNTEKALVTSIEVETIRNDESAAISLTNAGQEQSAPTYAEPQNEEANNGENAIPVDKTPSLEVSVAAEVSLPTEQLVDEDYQSEVDESKRKQAEIADNSDDENQTSEVKGSSNKAQERLEQAISEQEANPLKQLAEAAPTADKTDSTEIQQTIAAHLPYTKAEEVEVQPSATDLAHTKIEETEAQPSAVDLAHTKIEETEAQPSAVDLSYAQIEETEVAEAQPSDIDLARDEPAPTKHTEAPVSLEETAEATRTKDEQTEKPLPQAEDIRLNANAREEQPGIREDEHTRATEPEEQDNEPETAAAANDAPDWEEEPEKQMPWYEYLELEEPANIGENGAAQEHNEAEKTTDIPPDELVANGAVAPGTAEYNSAEKTANAQNSLLRPESTVGTEALEDENWQSWSASSASNEETLPFSLKEIQQAPYPLANDTQEGIVQEVIKPRDEAKDAISETHVPVTINNEATAQTSTTASGASLPVDEVPTEIRSEETRIAQPEAEMNGQTMDASPKREERPVSQAMDIAEQPTLMMDQLPQTPRESAANTGMSQMVYRANTPAPTQFTQTERAEKPPKKMGFWRRLFSFGRKRK